MQSLLEDKQERKFSAKINALVTPNKVYYQEQIVGALVRNQMVFLLQAPLQEGPQSCVKTLRTSL